MYFLVNPRASTGHKPTSLGDGVDIPGMPIRIAIGPPTGHRCGDGSVLKNRVTTPPPQKKTKSCKPGKKIKRAILSSNNHPRMIKHFWASFWRSKFTAGLVANRQLFLFIDHHRR